jgi:hypothetical protein
MLGPLDSLFNSQDFRCHEHIPAGITSPIHTAQMANTGTRGDNCSGQSTRSEAVKVSQRTWTDRVPIGRRGRLKVSSPGRRRIGKLALSRQFALVGSGSCKPKGRDRRSRGIWLPKYRGVRVDSLERRGTGQMQQMMADGRLWHKISHAVIIDLSFFIKHLWSHLDQIIRAEVPTCFRRRADCRDRGNLIWCPA